MLALTVWLAATGYALYYFSTDDNAAWLPLLHWIAGLALPLGLVLHIRLGRRRALPAATLPPSQGRHAVAPSYNPPARIKASP
jgi:cytochrome b561